jgi:hypothetical protein
MLFSADCTWFSARAASAGVVAGFVRGVALDRLDEVGQQVGTTLELHGDVAPRLIHPHIEPNQPVVGRPQVDTDDGDERDDDADDDECVHG